MARFALRAASALLCAAALSSAASSSASAPPHLIQMLVDDWGYFNVGWHALGNAEVQTPNLDDLVKNGVELDRAYIFKYCSPSRCALQTGRNPLQVNVLNDDMVTHNSSDPVGGWAGAARNFTGIATKLSSIGYSTHQIGKWDVGMGTPDHTPRGRGYNSSLIYFFHENERVLAPGGREEDDKAAPAVCARSPTPAPRSPTPLRAATGTTRPILLAAQRRLWTSGRTTRTARRAARGR